MIGKKNSAKRARAEDAWVKASKRIDRVEDKLKKAKRVGELRI